MFTLSAFYKSHSALFACLLVTLTHTSFTLTQESMIKQTAPSLTHQPTAEEIINTYLKPVQFSKNGIQSFFVKRFNTQLYTERFLPSCFIHLIDWLEYGAQMEKPHSYFESVFNLFHQRLKESNWTNPYAVITLLERLPEFIDSLTGNQNQALQKTLRAELENALLENFALLKNDPAAFLDQTAVVLSEVTQQVTDNNGSAHDLQNSIARFLEGALNKLIWNPQDGLDTWKSVKMIAKKCELLNNYGIIENSEEVNQLIWSLLYRFGYFLECAGSQMNYSFYRTIRQELKQDKLSFLKIEEQEEWITTKLEYLDRVLTEGEIKSQAYEQGILSDGVNPNALKI